MNSSARSGLCRILLSLVLVAGIWTHDGQAAIVEWAVLPDRDRVTVTLNREEEFAGGVTRVSSTGLLLDLGVPTAGMGQELAPENAKFFSMSEPRGRALAFFMKTDEFRFMVTRQNRNTVIINAFADPAAIGRPTRSANSDQTIFRSRINPGDTSDWDAMQSRREPGQSGMEKPSPATTSETPLSELPVQPTDTSGQPASPSVTPSSGTQAAETPPVKEYFDEEGNPVPPPVVPAEALAEIKRDIAAQNYKDALEKTAALMLHPELTSEETEELLHLNAELLFIANQDKLNENYDAITSATTKAMNYNSESPKNPAAYMRLGYLNLKVGNTVEADAYFTRLRRQYPQDENIPLSYYYWGEYYYDRGEMQEAADQFQYIISNYSSTPYAREASIGLARSYSALGYYQEAYDIIDYIDRRWPRLYLESPPILELMGDVGYHLGELDFALDRYMIYYNLLPDGPSADVILTRIGDIYARKRLVSAAKTAYTEAERRFPDKDGGLVAMMRLAETGINDTPEIQTMMSVFQGTSNFKTVDIYKKIIQDHPESELVPLAKLKLAMWYLANTQYEEALAEATDLAQKFPRHELVASAEDITMRAFASLAGEAATRNRPSELIANWQNNPVLKRQQDNLSPESRVALAQSMWKRGDPDGAMAMITPLFRGNKDPQNGEEALLLALTINLDHDQWQAIEKLGEQVALWELTPKTRQKLDYALALAKENMGRSTEAASIWSGMAQTGKLDEKEQAYAEYFLAREAEQERRLQDAYTYGTSALNRFLKLAQDNPEQADMGKINFLLSSLIDICETSGRFAEALDYANRYAANLSPDDPQQQGLMFRSAGIHRKQGNTQEWRRILTELAEKYPDSVHGRTAASNLRSSQLAEDAAQFIPGGF